MENDLVRYSRAGDEFHYRWAARRCLKLIYPKTSLEYIVVEGSGLEESELDGEYVMDVTEYSNSAENNSKKITYYQLKHTTTKTDTPFNLSDLRNTIEGFAARYSEHFSGGPSIENLPQVTFSIVTNRPISNIFKKNFSIIENGGRILRQDGEDHKFQKTVEEYTRLNGEHLQAFCASLEFADSEGDYNIQREELHFELSLMLAGTVEDREIANIIELVRTKVMPNDDGRIVREDVLKRFGVSSERDLFPAPPEFEDLDDIIKREQHDDILNCILEESSPIIIHAGGGVGKSIVANQLANSLPTGSFGIVYDCFGGGKYRNRSETRHRHRDALIQMANELASYGLCTPLIVGTSTEDQIMRKFLISLHSAITKLRQINNDAILAIFIDAADNAEMAAQEFNQSCFAHELLREKIPEGCRIVTLCRTERIHLLQPGSSILQILLEPFSNDETRNFLEQQFPTVTEDDSLEFHRLTGGNPRVQANALSGNEDSITQILTSLGPLGTTVEEQIEAQLNSAIAILKDQLPIDYQSSVDAICVGLAILPPFIPLTVLAIAADVNDAAVKSFVSDLGRPLWLSDTSVQFRDEPTETWFRDKFSATPDQIATYITRIEPLAQTYSYVAEALPSLLLQAEKYEDLVCLALSDELLPSNPIDQRNVRAHRLQFAFKAALKLGRFADANRLALRAGEEIAGNKRQLEILQSNIDLIAPLQSEQRVQEIAFRRLLRSEWNGSENVYSAALLSSVEDFKGEARVYLRSANNWLRLYFEERKENKGRHWQENLKDEDLTELLFAYYNLFGVVKAVEFLLKWNPQEVVYRLARPFVRKLVDAGEFDAIDQFARIGSRNQYLIIAIAYELQEVGRFLNADSLKESLILMTTKRTRIAKPRYSYNDTTPSAIVSFAEACAVKGLPKRQILRLLRHYFPQRASRTVSSQFQEAERNAYLRAVALKALLSGDSEPDLEELLPKDWFEKRQAHTNEQNIREFKEIVGGMLPWYFFRARLLINDVEDVVEAINSTIQRSIKARGNRWRDTDNLSYEISQVFIETLTFYYSADLTQIDRFFMKHLKENEQIRIPERLKAVRVAFRSEHLVGIRQDLEKIAFDVIYSATGEAPETRAEWYIELARAVLPVNPDDAAAYFDFAIESVSKFGDEIVERWDAVVAIASRTAEGGNISPEMAYRFIRCAELIGDNVAREKHFDRDGAIKTCVRLSPPSAFAALSRWRDRDVGWFYRQLSSLAFEVASSNVLSPSVSWSLSAFFDGYGLDSFASLCIAKEQSTAIKQIILDTAIRDLRLNEAGISSWQELEEVTQQENTIETRELEQILNFYVNEPPKKTDEISLPKESVTRREELEQVDWAKLLNGFELSTASGLSDAIQCYEELSATYRNHDVFWSEVHSRIDERDAVNFLKALVNAEYSDRYDVRNAVASMPITWRNKISVKRYWNEFLESYAKRFAIEITHRFILQYDLKDFDVGFDEMPSIRKGIIDGLARNSDLVDASTFFGFLEVGAPLISPKEAAHLLDYALARFETHINVEYADGEWEDWLTPPENISVAFAGFVWSALGSPRSEIRWRAVHCVQRLAETNCVSEIDALIEWMIRDEVGAFGSHKFPFYNLHAQQYLLIALARVSIDYPHILKSYQHVFVHHALENIEHVLIQKFAAEIALNIEKAFSDTYKPEIIEQLHKIGVSQLPVKQTERIYETNFSSPWHEREEINTELKFNLGYDFARYWLESLGRRFGIPSKQVEELVIEIIVNEWQVDNDGSYLADPRAYIWRSGQNERETWHDHGSYPRSDNLSFYLSYHSMFVVAARLLQQMPVVHGGDWHEDEWEEWLRGHTLTRANGYWLSDRRDPAPLVRRAWFYQEKSKDWRWEVTSTDFLDGLLIERDGETWLNVYGWWKDGDSQREENFHISTALVLPEASQSLLNALTTCPPNDFKLPAYEEERMEFDVYPFELKGWVWYEDSYKGLDEFDPYAGTVIYPPYHIGEAIADKLQLTADKAMRNWYLPDKERASLVCELWGTNKVRQDEDPLRQGRRLSASLSFLKRLCEVFACELIFDVQIERRYRQKRYSNSNEGNEYAPPYHKIYVLSADGKIRDTRTYFQLRESLS